MAVHKLRLNKVPFESIKCGKKTVEMRLYDEKRKMIKVGDNIEFSLRDDECQTIMTKVVSINVFDSFKSLYDCFDKSMLGYIENEVASYTDMEEYYSKEEQALFGVVAIGIEVC